MDLEAKCAEKSTDVLLDDFAVTKWHQVHTRVGEARGQIDPFPEMNYLHPLGYCRFTASIIMCVWYAKKYTSGQPIRENDLKCFDISYLANLILWH